MEQVITTDLICLDVEAESKEDVIRLLAEKLDKAGRLNDKDEYIAEVFKREETYATGVGFSVATPHAKTDAVKTGQRGLRPPEKGDPLGRRGRRHHDFPAGCALHGGGRPSPSDFGGPFAEADLRRVQGSDRGRSQRGGDSGIDRGPDRGSVACIITIDEK